MKRKKPNVWFYIFTKRSCVAKKSSILPCYISIFNWNKFGSALIFYYTENLLCVILFLFINTIYNIIISTNIIYSINLIFKICWLQRCENPLWRIHVIRLLGCCDIWYYNNVISGMFCWVKNNVSSKDKIPWIIANWV